MFNYVLIRNDDTNIQAAVQLFHVGYALHNNNITTTIHIVCILRMCVSVCFICNLITSKCAVIIMLDTGCYDYL